LPMHFVSEELQSYCARMSSQPSEICREIADYTREKVPGSQMLIGPLEASFLASLIRLRRVKRVLELGTYTGYSALAMAEQLPDDGRVTTLDINSETTEIAKAFWSRSPHGKKIEAFVGVASETLQALESGFDLVFIDADKGGYVEYLKRCLELLSEGGCILADNCLYSAQVLKPEEADRTAQGIIRFNEYVSSQRDLWVSLLPIRDGIFMIQKK